MKLDKTNGLRFIGSVGEVNCHLTEITANLIDDVINVSAADEIFIPVNQHHFFLPNQKNFTSL